MTTPNNPTPPPGYRLLTRDEYRSSSKRGTVVFNFVDQSWAERDFHCEPMDKSLFYAIPITPTVPATGDATKICRCNPHFWSNRHNPKCPIHGDTTNEKGGDQRQNKAFLEAAITEQIAHAEHWKEHYTADPKGAEDKAYWKGRHTAFQEALNLIQSAPVDQRQELLPCPFCGSSVDALKDGIHCQHPPGDCWASGYQFTIPEWNTRK